jgi:hypothetical protein
MWVWRYQPLPFIEWYREWMSLIVGLFCGSHCYWNNYELLLYRRYRLRIGTVQCSPSAWGGMAHTCYQSTWYWVQFFGNEINMLYDYIGRTGVSSFTLWIFSLLMYMCTVLTSFNRRKRQSNTYLKTECHSKFYLCQWGPLRKSISFFLPIYGHSLLFPSTPSCWLQSAF